MNFLVIIAAALVSIFIFLLLINFNHKNLSLVINKMEIQAGYIYKKMNKTKSDKDLKLLFEEQNGTNIFGIKIKSLEGFILKYHILVVVGVYSVR